MSDRLHDALDSAIDRVAAGLVRVPDDPAAVGRIVSSLPARREAAQWGPTSWAVHAAALAAILLAVVYIRTTSDDHLPGGTAPHTAVLDARPMLNVVELQSASALSGQSRPIARSVNAPARTERSLATEPAFELTPIVTPDSLSLSVLQATAPLAPIEPATVAPITLTELPLATDAPPPSSKE